MRPDAEAFKAAADYAQTLLGWSLLVLGGSAAALLQSSYRRPRSAVLRGFCALAFIPGWFFLARSIYFGTRVYQVYMAVIFSANPDRKVLRIAINSDLSSQITDLQRGIWFFAGWLLLLLGYWVFSKEIVDDKG